MKYSVLVVDDEYLIAKNIAKKIESTNPAFEVSRICSSGSEAMDAIREKAPDVVFTDIQMPEISGLKLARFLSEEYPYIICVIVSGYDDFSYAKKAISYNVRDYLLKPVSKDDLQSCLAQIEKRFNASHDHLADISNRDKIGGNSREIVALVKEYIQQNYHTQVNLASLADNFGFSSAYLTKIFVKNTNMTPSRYLKEYRMKIAMQMLRDPSIPISTISTQTGFLDQFHFSKTFKGYAGVSPSSYRARILSETSGDDS